MFDGLKNLGQMAELMRKAADVKQRMRVIQDEVARQEHVAEAGLEVIVR